MKREDRFSWKKVLLLSLFNTLVFWAIDVISHLTGGTETTFYYTSKLFNSLIFSIIIFRYVWDYTQKGQWHKVIISLCMGTIISVYYNIVSYQFHLVQKLGIVALSSPPTFFNMSPIWWFFAHSLYFWIALNISSSLERITKEGIK